MGEYFYIKIKSVEYDQPDWFLVEDGFSHSPKGVRIFYTIDEASEVKRFYRKVTRVIQ